MCNEISSPLHENNTSTLRRQSREHWILVVVDFVVLFRVALHFFLKLFFKTLTNETAGKIPGEYFCREEKMDTDDLRMSSATRNTPQSSCVFFLQSAQLSWVPETQRCWNHVWLWELHCTRAIVKELDCGSGRQTCRHNTACINNGLAVVCLSSSHISNRADGRWELNHPPPLIAVWLCMLYGCTLLFG